MAFNIVKWRKPCKIFSDHPGTLGFTQIQEVSQQILQGKQESWILNLFFWFVFFSSSGHWLGGQLVEITGIFFFQWCLKMWRFFEQVPVPSVLTQYPTCPVTSFQSCCSCSCLCSSCCFPASQLCRTNSNHQAEEFTWKTHSFLNSLCLDLLSLSYLPQLTPLHLARFPYLFILLLFSLLMRY